MAASVWDWLAGALSEVGCEAVVGLPSDESGLLDAAVQHPDLKALSVHDQRAGACVALGYAIASGRPSVLALNTGPGFTNAITGLLEAASLSVPLMVITTRAASAELGRGAFQEVDQIRMLDPLTKWSATVERPEDLSWAVRRAADLAVNGRPGLTLLELTSEVCDADYRDQPTRCPAVRRRRTGPVPEGVKQAAAVLQSAARPVIVVGGGARWSPGTGADLAALATRLGAAVLTTAAGRGVIDEREPLALGVAGLYATSPVADFLDDCDVVLAVGTRLEETVRMGWSNLAEKRIIRIDCDEDAFTSGPTAEVELLGDAQLSLEALVRNTPESAGLAQTRGERLRAIEASKAELAAEARGLTETSTCAMAVRELMTVFPDAIFAQENGLHDMWSYQFPISVASPANQFIGPGEQTMMGFSVPTALGAAQARPSTPVVAITGDGAMLMNLPVLHTVRELDVPMTIVVFDNAGYGWPRHVRTQARKPDVLTRFKEPVPFEEITRSFGGVAFTPTTRTEVPDAVRQARESNERGRFAVIRIAVAEDDVPSGVRRLEVEE